MKYIKKLSQGKKLESTMKNQNDIYDALENIIGYTGKIDQEIFILLDEINEKAFLALRKDAFTKEEQYLLICLKREIDATWSPKLFHGSQGFQLYCSPKK